MEQPLQQHDKSKTAYSVLLEIQNQLKMLRRVTYDYATGDETPVDTGDELLGIHNTLLDIEMKLAMLTEEDDLEAIKAPAALQIW